MPAVLVLCHVVVWASLFLVAYPLTLYPLLLGLLARIRPRPWQVGDDSPRVSVLIAAHNEARIIDRKLENTLALDYPADRLEVLVISDASTDGTAEVVRGFEDRDVRLLEQTERVGKQEALNRGAASATGEVLLFTDAAAFFRRNALRKLVRHLADPQVGATSCVIAICPTLDSALEHALEDTGPTERAGHAEGRYLDFDFIQRRLESQIGSAVGCCGAGYLVRRECFVPFDAGAASDFASALDAVERGRRVVMDPEALACMSPARRGGDEFRRKVRTIAGGIDTLRRSGYWRRPWRNPLFTWQLLSHKVARWAAPVFLALAYAGCVVGALLGDSLLRWPAALGAAFVLGGLAALFAPALANRIPPLRLCGFILVSLAAGVAAWAEVLRGRRQLIWNPTER